LRQQLVGKPASELRLRRVVEGSDREVIENKPPMSAPGSPGPLVALANISLDAEPGRQMPDNRRGEIGFLVGKSTGQSYRLRPNSPFSGHSHRASYNFLIVTFGTLGT
jgi:hypothetical protein